MTETCVLGVDHEPPFHEFPFHPGQHICDVCYREVTGGGSKAVEEMAPWRVDWDTFWTRDRTAPEWLIEPVLPAGQSVATYATAGIGKSELALVFAAAAATGREILGRDAGDPLNIVYLDLEQSEAHLWDRLMDLEYGPGDDLEHLVYYLLPDLPPLDTAAGGVVLRDLAAAHKAHLVIIDTTARVLEGAENEADTLRAFHRHTGILLKADGRTVWRLDHAGKDPDRGQRGTSAKNDDVDLVWQMDRRDNGVRLTARKRRASWVPETVNLDRQVDPLRYTLGGEVGWPPGTQQAADLLTQLGVPVDAGRPTVRQMLAGTDHRMSNEVLRAALRFRRLETPNTPVTHRMVERLLTRSVNRSVTYPQTVSGAVSGYPQPGNVDDTPTVTDPVSHGQLTPKIRKTPPPKRGVVGRSAAPAPPPPPPTPPPTTDTLPDNLTDFGDRK